MPKGKFHFRTRDEAFDMHRTREMSASISTREDGATVLSFSTEKEIEIWPGEFEVLSHAPGACDLSRMEASGMLLFNHNRNAQLARIGEIGISATDKTGRCVIPKELRSETTFASETWRDIDKGVLRNSSVGYRPIAWTESKRADGSTLYTVTKWEPSEVSIVTVPADISTGVDRSENTQSQNAENQSMNPRYAKRYQPNRFNDPDDGGTRTQGGSSPNTPAPVVPPAANPGAVTVIEDNARAAGANVERTRVTQIIDVCRTYNAPDIQTRALSEGLTLDAVRALLLEHVSRQNEGVRENSLPIGMSNRDIQAFSFVNLIRAMCDPQDRNAQERARHETTCCRAAAEKKPSTRGGMVIPVDVLLSPASPDVARQMMARQMMAQSIRAAGMNISATAINGGTGDGSNVIQTLLLASSFVEILRHRCLLMGLGTELTGLVGNMDIPKMTSSQFGGGWVGEDVAAPQTAVDFGLIPIIPKTAAAYAYITRRMLTQPSVGVEGIVRMDIAKKMGQTIDLGGYYGTGENSDPVGLLNTTGINAVGFAGTNPTYDELVAMETSIALEDADVESMCYIGNANFRGYAKTTLKFPMTQNAQGQLTQVASAGTIWEAGATAKDGMVNGYAAKITNQLSPGDLFLGNFQDLIIGLWGGLEIIADPYTYSKQGGISISTFQDVDFAVRRLQSFCYGSQAATTQSAPLNG